eukprot:g69149.t1
MTISYSLFSFLYCLFYHRISPSDPPQMISCATETIKMGGVPQDKLSSAKCERCGQDPLVPLQISKRFRLCWDCEWVIFNKYHNKWANTIELHSFVWSKHGGSSRFWTMVAFVAFFGPWWLAMSQWVTPGDPGQVISSEPVVGLPIENQCISKLLSNIAETWKPVAVS